MIKRMDPNALESVKVGDAIAVIRRVGNAWTQFDRPERETVEKMTKTTFTTTDGRTWKKRTGRSLGDDSHAYCEPWSDIESPKWQRAVDVRLRLLTAITAVRDISGRLHAKHSQRGFTRADVGNIARTMLLHEHTSELESICEQLSRFEAIL